MEIVTSWMERGIEQGITRKAGEVCPLCAYKPLFRSELPQKHGFAAYLLSS